MTSDQKQLRPRLALFDLDHTLLPLDSDYEWGEFTTRIGWTDPVEFGRRNAEFFAHYQAGTLDVHDYVRFATEAFCARGAQQAAEAHERFMREVITRHPSPGTGAAAHAPAGGRPDHHRHGHQRVRDAPHRRRPRRAGIDRGGTGARRAGLVHGRDPWHAQHARRQGAAHAAVAGCARPAVERRGDLLLQRLLERRSPARARGPPRGHQPRHSAARLAQERGWRILDLFGEAP